jgi:hypothetical protein
MPAIRMIHPEHGAMHAYDDAEQKRLERDGWKVEGAKVELEVVKAVDFTDSARAEMAAPAPKRAYVRKAK